MNKTVKSTCCYCGVGCGVLIDTLSGQIVGVRGDPEHPANFGRLCTKGATLHLTARPDYRLLHPQLRRERHRPRQRVDWDEALEYAAGRFAEIIRAHGPDSVAFYVSGQLLTEDYYVFNKLAKGLVGTNNIDTNSRLCMSSAVAGYKQTLGADAPPCSYADILQAKVIFIAGANPAYAHPILYRRIEAARAAGLGYIPGVEVSVTWAGETIHVVGLRVAQNCVHRKPHDGAAHPLRHGQWPGRPRKLETCDRVVQWNVVRRRGDLLRAGALEQPSAGHRTYVVTHGEPSPSSSSVRSTRDPRRRSACGRSTRHCRY